MAGTRGRRLSRQPPDEAHGSGCGAQNASQACSHNRHGAAPARPSSHATTDGVGTRNRTRVRHLNRSPSARTRSRICVIRPFSWTLARLEKRPDHGVRRSQLAASRHMNSRPGSIDCGQCTFRQCRFIGMARRLHCHAGIPLFAWRAPCLSPLKLNQP